MTWFRHEEVLKPSEVAERLQVTTQTVYNWINLGLKVDGVCIFLRAHQVGSRKRIIGREINEFIEKQEKE